MFIGDGTGGDGHGQDSRPSGARGADDGGLESYGGVLTKLQHFAAEATIIHTGANT